ncbi:BZ3500_MvSof-1268-A1-R1_Chr8-1g09756 [Microbotryum saponariae]|uniref:BZ3500_MvSof-1268-A1-R1_Chr8-1g09756 protein n=1 Tax=Microbotryum saponariae TaxID=289078 RepID=A0A2X0MUG4_9BASI|nr:BZ3500_MvSof-1268-A1-R1_Chr8-1g09756 [Microbotryum saponariae]SDA08042.1 BZ3501_MvSof-1269-A2-R1_Chr8-1g09479 [Microbotryum saponariae]
MMFARSALVLVNMLMLQSTHSFCLVAAPKTFDQTASVLLPGNCTLLATSPIFVANGTAAARLQVFIGPEIPC